VKDLPRAKHKPPGHREPNQLADATETGWFDAVPPWGNKPRTARRLWGRRVDQVSLPGSVAPRRGITVAKVGARQLTGVVGAGKKRRENVASPSSDAP